MIYSQDILEVNVRLCKLGGLGTARLGVATPLHKPDFILCLCLYCLDVHQLSASFCPTLTFFFVIFSNYIHWNNVFKCSTTTFCIRGNLCCWSFESSPHKEKCLVICKTKTKHVDARGCWTIAAPLRTHTNTQKRKPFEIGVEKLISFISSGEAEKLSPGD